MTRLMHGEFYADIITDWRDSRPYFVYVVQKHGSADVLAMGCCDSDEAAIACATEAMDHLRGYAATA